MKTKISITLESYLVDQLDRLTEPDGSRSALIERVLESYLLERRRAAADARDSRRLDRHAEELNREALDVREYQAPWPDDD